MTHLNALFEQLIGRKATIEGHDLEIVDWLITQQSLVLCDTQSELQGFQESQYGTTSRRVSETWTLHYLNDTRTAIHPVIAQFMSSDEIRLVEENLG